MKKTTTFLLLGIVFNTAYSQSGFTSTGGDIVGLDGKLSYSVGQIDYVNLVSQEGKLSAGMQQTYVISKITDINTSYSNFQIEVYPNPTTNELNIKAYTSIEALKEYTISDINGNVLQKKSFTNLNVSINISEYPSALYILQIIDIKNQVQSFKIIKQ